MPSFTRPDDTPINITAASVARARPTIRNEIYGRPGHVGTALFKPRQMVLEAIDVVGPALQAEVPSFTMLHAPNGASIWFDAKKARDAEPPKAYETSENVNAVVVIGGIRQRVSENVADAQAIIDAARAGA